MAAMAEQLTGSHDDMKISTISTKVETHEDLLASLENAPPIVDDPNAIIIITMSEETETTVGDGRDATEQAKDKLCAICNKLFRHVSSLRRHMQTHSSETSVVNCPTCDKAFEYGSSLKRHMRTHSNDNEGKNYECNKCLKRFMYSTSLQRHLRKHIEQGSSDLYRCDECDRTFNYLSSLKRHESLHTLGKQFACSICGKSFGYSASLMRHEKLHSRERQFFCSPCQKSFRMERSYNKHLKMHHSSSTIEETGVQEGNTPTMLTSKITEECTWNDEEEALLTDCSMPTDNTLKKEE